MFIGINFMDKYTEHSRSLQKHWINSRFESYEIPNNDVNIIKFKLLCGNLRNDESRRQDRFLIICFLCVSINRTYQVSFTPHPKNTVFYVPFFLFDFQHSSSFSLINIAFITCSVVLWMHDILHKILGSMLKLSTLERRN